MIQFTPPDVVAEIDGDPKLARSLRLLVREDGGRRVGVLKVAYEMSHVQYVDIPPATWLEAQVAHWLSALSVAANRDSALRRLAPALAALPRRTPDADPIFVGTIRRLLFLETLFTGNSIREEVKAEVQHLRQQVPRLDEALRRLDQTHLPLPGRAGGRWRVWLPLVLVLAVAPSQCESFRPVCWEAYSASRARADLGRPFLFPGDLSPLLDLVALLIRFQSSMGQLARGTGGSQFVSELARFASRCGLGAPVVEAALRVLALVGETGYHALFLFDLRRRGLAEIEARLLKLGADETAEVRKDRVTFRGSQAGEVVLDRFGLTSREINDYLDEYGPRFGFLKAPAAREDEEATTYTRWDVTAGD